MRFLLFIFLNLIITNSVLASEKSKAYFAGGCFWCMEESFEKLTGVEKVISGYSGGKTENPTYEEVTYGNTGHLEVVEVIYDASLISFEELLKNFWLNIDPFDPFGQFCDKGYSYRSAAFYTNQKEKDLIEKDIIKLEKKFNKKVNTYVREFKKFYVAENFHQNYYEVYFLNYLKYNLVLYLLHVH